MTHVLESVLFYVQITNKNKPISLHVLFKNIITVSTDCSNYHCANGLCVSNSSRCNGENDCGDGSDEYDCGKMGPRGGGGEGGEGGCVCGRADSCCSLIRYRDEHIPITDYIHKYIYYPMLYTVAELMLCKGL